MAACAVTRRRRCSTTDDPLVRIGVVATDGRAIGLRDRAAGVCDASDFAREGRERCCCARADR